MNFLYCSLPALIIVLLVTYVVSNALHANPAYDQFQLPTLSARPSEWPRWAQITLMIAALLVAIFGPALLCGLATHIMAPY